MEKKLKKGIVHFDIDSSFVPYFKNTRYYHFSLNEKNLSKINHFNQVNIVTIKSNSSLTEKVIEKFPCLEAIITRTVGTNHIDLDTCKKRKIAVFHIPDYGSFAIAEHVFALLLSQTRKIISLHKETKLGKFSWENGQGFSLKNKTLGIIGVGRTGKETAMIARGFQMKILGFDKYKNKEFAQKFNLTYISLNKLLKDSDVISINIPLIRETYHLIGEKEIRKMKSGVILINVSRGEILDTKALAKNLTKFKYVCLDVLEGEARYDPRDKIIKKLIDSDKVVITPHVAFFTDLTTRQIATLTYKNINNYLEGSQENRVI